MSSNARHISTFGKSCPTRHHATFTHSPSVLPPSACHGTHHWRRRGTGASMDKCSHTSSVIPTRRGCRCGWRRAHRRRQHQRPNRVGGLPGKGKHLQLLGVGLLSEPVRVRTLVGFLIKALINYRANAHNSFKVTWNAPLTQFENRLIQGYKLSMLENNLPDKPQTHVIDVSNHQGPFSHAQSVLLPSAGYSSTPSTRSAFSASPTPTTDRPFCAYKWKRTRTYRTK